MLRRLSKLVAPRVFAAVLRTLWSGWCTARRFGRRSPCLFCGEVDGDSVEHASVCFELAQFGRRELGLPYFCEPDLRRINFLLLDGTSQLSDTHLVLGALRAAAAYQLHCGFRRRRRDLQGVGVVRMALLQATKQLVQGHSASTSVFDGRWAR